MLDVFTLLMNELPSFCGNFLKLSESYLFSNRMKNLRLKPFQLETNGAKLLKTKKTSIPCYIMSFRLREIFFCLVSTQNSFDRIFGMFQFYLHCFHGRQLSDGLPWFGWNGEWCDSKTMPFFLLSIDEFSFWPRVESKKNIMWKFTATDTSASFFCVWHMTAGAKWRYQLHIIQLDGASCNCRQCVYLEFECWKPIQIMEVCLKILIFSN